MKKFFKLILLSKNAYFQKNLRFFFLVFLAISLFAATASTAKAASSDVEVNRWFESGYVPGKTVDITLTVTGTKTLVSIGFEELLPDGWTFNSMVEDAGMDVKPTAGACGKLGFIWMYTLPPPLPFSIVYRVNVPQDAEGEYQWSGTYSWAANFDFYDDLPIGGEPFIGNDAPVIITQPQSQSVNEGVSVTFSVVAKGSNLGYQWKKDGTDISGAISPSCSIVGVKPRDAGSYTVAISNMAGTVVSSEAVLTVSAKPVIITQPQSQSVDEGASVTFSVVASGSNLSYQWKKDGADVSGATKANYTIGSANPIDAGSYTVVVSSAAGSVTSNAAILTVSSKPVIITHPQSQTVNEGASVTFSVNASGNGLSYQWKKDGTVISGATQASYTIGSVKSNNAGSYTVTVTNSAGSVTSDAAILTVTSKPIIITHPQSQTVNEGASVTFSVSASGNGLNYQWKKDGTAISGATQASYTIGSVKKNDAGRYTVTVTNSVGSVTSNAAILTVIFTPTITTQPQSQTVNEGGSVTFSVNASGNGLSYQWKKDGTAISGATQANYTISNVKSNNAGSYTVTVTNSAGSVTSDAAILTVTSKPIIITQPQSQTVNEGASVTFSVSATGNGLSYQWKKDGSVISGATQASYAIASVKPVDAGSYTVIVSSAAGYVTSDAAILTVISKPIITTQPQSQTVTEGSSVTFNVTSSGADLQYQWYKDGKAINGATEENYTISTVRTDDAGNYTVTVSNSVGSVTSDTAILTVVILPVITNQPRSQTVNEGGFVTFSVTASGIGLHYQWKRNGTNIVGAIRSGYTIVNVKSADAGNYTVTISNTGGSVVSEPATLSVISKPVITTQPKSKTVNIGESVTFFIVASGTDLKYQWYKNGEAITDATETGYTIESAKSEDAGNYTVVVSNAAGSITSEKATLEVNVPVVLNFISISGESSINTGDVVTYTCAATYSDKKIKIVKAVWSVVLGNDCASINTSGVLTAKAVGSAVIKARYSEDGITKTATKTVTINAGDIKPTILEQPESKMVIEGESVTFYVKASGTALKYQWYKDNKAIEGAIESSYTIDNTQISDAGSYTVNVSNNVGFIISDAAILSISQPITKPTILKQPESQTATIGSSVTFSVVASGTNLKYQWYKDGETISGATSSGYTISPVKSSDAGNYTVSISNSAGSVTSNPAVLTVSEPVVKPIIETQPRSQTVTVGSSVTFSVVASGTNLKYQWYKDGETISGATSSGYTINPVKSSDAGNYTVSISNSAGSVTSNPAILTITQPIDEPIILTHPKSQTATTGESVTFSVVAKGTNLKYQWYKDTETIVGATEASYTIAQVQTSDAGSYTVTVSNSDSSLTSNPALLTVKPIFPDGLAIRTIRTSGLTATVTLTLIPNEAVGMYFVEEIVPPIGKITPYNGGIYTSSKNLIRWTFMGNGIREVSYTVTVPNVLDHVEYVSGEVIFDINPQITIGDNELEFTTQFHPADLDDNFEISSAEVSHYITSWRYGSRWGKEPMDIPMNYASRAATIWINGGTYTYDFGKSKPFCWANEAVLPPSAETSIAERTVDVSDGKAIIAIEILPSDGTGAYFVEERLSSNAAFSVSGISNAGYYISSQNAIRWYFMDGEPRALTYTVVPKDRLDSNITLSGEVSFNEEIINITGECEAAFGAKLAYELEDNVMVLNFTGTLYESEDGINWIPVEGATSPYRIDISQGSKFYRSVQ